MRTDLATAAALLFLPIGGACMAGDAETQQDRADAPQPILRVLFMGNSLSRHGPSTEKLGWSGNWGMAATALEKDYAHQFYQRVCAYTGNPEPDLKIVNLLARNLPSYEAFSKRWDAGKPADVVVVQCGDNLSPAKATEQTFAKPYEALIRGLLADGAGTILCTSVWGDCKVRNPMIERACKRTGAVYVYLGDLAAKPENRASSEGHFSHSGVGWHPGDGGMKAIAERLWQALAKRLRPKE